MDLVLEGAGTRRGDDEETYDDEDMFTPLCIAVRLCRSNNLLSSGSRRRVCSLPRKRENLFNT